MWSFQRFQLNLNSAKKNCKKNSFSKGFPGAIHIKTCQRNPKDLWHTFLKARRTTRKCFLSSCQDICDFGKGGATKLDEFSEKFQRGGGHFQSKNLYCRFWTFIKGLFSDVLWKYLQHNFPKMRGVGVEGRLEFFQKFIRFGSVIRTKVLKS